MSIPNTQEIKRKPTHPGAILREDFMTEFDVTASGLAEALDISKQTIEELIQERRAVCPEMALRLSRLFGNSPEFWLNAQRAVDLWEAKRAIQPHIDRIRPLSIA